MADPAAEFQLMRARLVAQGLLEAVGDEFRLTDAGNAHVEVLIERLLVEEAPEPSKPPVRWNFDRRAPSAGVAHA